MNKKVSAAGFDMDETLARPYQSPAPEMALLVKKLAEKIPVAIFSGAGLDRIQRDFLSQLGELPSGSKLYLFPNSASEAYLVSGGELVELYKRPPLSDEDRDRIKKAIDDAVHETGILNGGKISGEQFIDRGSQIAYAMLGTSASDEVRNAWDSDGKKRQALLDALLMKLPEFDVRVGGKTSVDITKIFRAPDGTEVNYNKAYGVRKLAELENIPIEHIAYTGDAFFPGGNDEVVKKNTKAQIHEIHSIEETAQVIDGMLADLE